MWISGENMKWDRATEIVTLLNPKTSTTEERVQGLQGGLSGFDVVAATKGSPSIQRHIIVAVSNGEESSIIKDWLKGVAIRLSDRDKWRCEYDRKVVVAGIAYDEVCHSERCKCCKGRGKALNKFGGLDKCEACSGDGFIKNSWEDNANLIGVKKSTYFSTWKPRLDSLVMVFDMNYNECISLIKMNL